MAEISTAPVQGLADGGYLATVSDAGTPGWSRTPLSEVHAGVVLATTALQPANVGTAAMLNVEEVATAAELTAALAAQVAINASLQAQIDALVALSGAGEVTVYEAGIYEPGIYT